MFDKSVTNERKVHAFLAKEFLLLHMCFKIIFKKSASTILYYILLYSTVGTGIRLWQAQQACPY